jgi:hypothetical protein
MKYIILLSTFLFACSNHERKIFDVHLHGDLDAITQFQNLEANGVYGAAVSSSWEAQQQLNDQFESSNKVKILNGLFVPCPLGKVPYSRQMKTCYENGNEWPDVLWVEQQIKENKVDFIGEVLTQYFGISSSDTTMYPFYALAEKYNLPVGIHTGSAGPDHGCPNFKEEMGNPVLLQTTLNRFPNLKVWYMHGGVPFVKEFIEMMKTYPNLYADISVLNNPKIVPPKDFASLLKLYIDSGLEDRLMFGTDNADIKTTVNSIEELDFLSSTQKEKIFFRNAQTFFHPKAE